MANNCEIYSPFILFYNGGHKKKMELLLVRHGQSQNNEIARYNRKNKAKIKGFLNSPLTPLGEKQSESVGQRIATLKPDVIASSTLKRALQTALPAARLLDLPIEVINDAHEVRLGADYMGLAIHEMKEMFPEAVFSEQHMIDNRWQYLSDQEIGRARERAIRLIDHLLERYKEKRVAIFLHGNLNRLLFQSILGPSTIDKIHIDQPNTCINRITFKKDRIHVHSIGDVTHLIQSGVPIT